MCKLYAVQSCIRTQESITSELFEDSAAIINVPWRAGPKRLNKLGVELVANRAEVIVCREYNSEKHQD